MSVPNQRAEGMTYIGAWCPDEMVSAIERWILREKKKRRVNRTDFIVEAAMEKLASEGIEISQGSDEFRTGHIRKQVIFKTPHHGHSNSDELSEDQRILKKVGDDYDRKHRKS